LIVVIVATVAALAALAALAVTVAARSAACVPADFPNSDSSTEDASKPGRQG
jgi:hypothetical protein